ncbi:MAG: hypothetical protein IKG87_14795 [Clostridia bacterium]|nr:hypothetical protein [Clostridia bacterium]
MNRIHVGRNGTRFELYSQMEERYGRGHQRITIRRKVTASSKCRGFCFYDYHPGFLTDQEMANRHCEERNCEYFLPKPRKNNAIQK